MKTLLFLICGILIGLISCEKKDPENSDYRDTIVGDYNGIRIDMYWIDTIVGWGHDSSMVIINLTKSELDSVIDISFNPIYSSEPPFSFKYNNGKFISTSYYHPPTLKLTSDSLFFRHQAGLGPRWTECFAKKNE